MKKVLLLALLAAGCSQASHGGGGFASQTSTTPGSTVAVTSSATALPYPLPLELATRHAPIYRFNAWEPNDPSVGNRDEDFFPESVVRFFDEISSQKARVSTQLAKGPNPGTNEVEAFAGTVTITSTQITGFPQRMSGDAPGAAPVYFHAFEDVSQRVRNPDGSGEDLWYVEYWLFYPKDLCLVSIYTLPIPFAIGGHRGDWESTSFAIAVLLGPGGAFQTTELRRGYYNAHDFKYRCQRSDLELAGEHPYVYVSVGKHGEYPEPGAWHDRFKLSPFVHFDEFFLGNGFEWDSRTSQLVDLDGPLSNEFAPPGFIAIPSHFTDWRDFPGGWGPDKRFGPLDGSPVSARWAKVYGQGDALVTDEWSHVRATAPHVVWGRGPLASPPPVPVRR